MGKGDKKSRKGKQWKKSYGNSRNRNAIKAKIKRASSKKIEKPASADGTAKPKKVAKKKADA